MRKALIYSSCCIIFVLAFIRNFQTYNKVEFSIVNSHISITKIHQKSVSFLFYFIFVSKQFFPKYIHSNMSW